MQNRGFGFPTIPIGIEIEGAGEGRKGGTVLPLNCPVWYWLSINNIQAIPIGV